MEVHTTRTLNWLFFITNFLVSIGFLLKNKPTEIANPAVSSIFFAAIILLERFSIFKLKNYIRLMLLITLTSHSLIGEYLRFYYTTAFFDNALHFFGAFTFALLAFDLLNSFIEVHSSRPGVLVFLIVFLCGTSLGVFFELIEYSLDVLLKENNQFGLIDTDLDLLFNVLGSVTAGMFMCIKYNKTH